MKLKYEIPSGFSEEVKYFRFFTVRTLCVMGVVAFPGVLLIRFMTAVGLTVKFLVFWGVLTAICTVATMIPIGQSKWMEGAGNMIDQYLLKKFIRSRKRCLYIKGYNELQYEEEEKEKMNGLSA